MLCLESSVDGFRGVLDLCFSGEECKSRHKHSSNQKKLIIESACARIFVISFNQE